jgi:hypothetical protein
VAAVEYAFIDVYPDFTAVTLKRIPVPYTDL